ncbi:cupin domain-containing protein [Rhizorhapis sp. SPR117]|uniref:cupin domain-containing protein n=1 Tax=Rhizorhapis sp. SPR117 TaxID=2912611 RepID=UPI001F2CC586|nr:cupin domain-containing protein [Rhizorhapis sp. SPR117]
MPQEAGFQIFRKADAYRFGTEGVLTTDPTEVQADGLQRMIEAGVMDGAEMTMLVNLPGFGLVHAWIKKDYPLPLHSHSGDGLYYIISGTLRLGTETLGPGDSVFIPANVPYTYRAGPEGVELLEFQHTLDVDFKNYSKNRAFYDKAVSTILANRDAWREAEKPRAGDEFRPRA